MNLPDFKFELECWQNGFKFVAGLDEVGRGAFAGPVVAAAVAFAPNYKLQITNAKLRINDSKKLNSYQREKVDVCIRENCLAFGIGSASVGLINKLGIKKATDVAFRRAIREVNERLRYIDTEILENKKQTAPISKYLSIEYLLIDAFNIPRVPGLQKHKQNAIVKGDSLSISIAAASIIAKVYRDKLMTELSSKPKYKKYMWHKNKGYGTQEHRNAILKHGVTKLHRKAFVNTWISKLT